MPQSLSMRSVSNNVYELIITIVFNVILAIGIATPLVIALVKYVKQSIQKKNWNNLVKLVLELISTAEEKFETGAERKEWVIDMVRVAENQINFDIDEETLSNLIDDLVNLTKKVNIK